MSYYKLLRNIVVESGLSSTEIIKECREKGRKIDKAYFSRLLNGKCPPPSEELSRLLANICNADERALVLEGYIDKAPKEIKECLEKLEKATLMTTLKVFNDKININDLENIMNELPTSSFIIQILDTDLNNNSNIFELSNNDTKITVTEPISLEIKDNSMSPLIPEHSRINLKIDKYKNGDILAIKTKDFESFIVRYVLFSGSSIILISLNKEYKPMTYKIQDIEILGKVSQIINTIQ